MKLKTFKCKCCAYERGYHGRLAKYITEHDCSQWPRKVGTTVSRYGKAQGGESYGEWPEYEGGSAWNQFYIAALRLRCDMWSNICPDLCEEQTWNVVGSIRLNPWGVAPFNGAPTYFYGPSEYIDIGEEI